MREVLIALGMLAAGRTTSYNPSGSGGEVDYAHVDDRGRPRLATGDAPHLVFAQRWDAAGDDDERAAVLEAARDELDRARRSRADPNAVESKRDRDARIVREGAGWPAREVATTFRTGIKDVWNARRAAGRELEFGELPSNGREMSRAERNAEILRLAKLGMNPFQISKRLGLPNSSVRYVLACRGERKGSQAAQSGAARR